MNGGFAMREQLVRCNGCGRTDVPTVAYRCLWPDRRVTTERHCPACRLTWQRQLKWLGATIEELAPEVPSEERREKTSAKIKPL